MKEKDLDKHLDNLIIKGLIQEAEQDNADFEAAMRNMSDEDFLALIYDMSTDPKSKPSFRHSTEDSFINSFRNPVETKDKDLVISKNMNRASPKEESIEVEYAYKDNILYNRLPSTGTPIHLDKAERISPADEGYEGSSRIEKESKRKNWIPWVASIAAAAAILLIVLIPASRSMDSRICESALLASNAFMSPTKAAADLSQMPIDEVKEMLPMLEKQYSILKNRSEGIKGITGADKIDEDDDILYYAVLADPQEAALDLVQAYLRLNERDKAKNLLGELVEKYGDSKFGNHCKKLLEILE